MAVNYLKELRGFYDYSMYNGVSTGEVALWYTLMAINNRLGWLDEFAVNNSILRQLTALSKSGLDYARNGLKQRGLIDYVPGKGNRPGKYRMISFDGNISDAVLDTIPDIVRTQNIALSGHNTGPLYNKVLTKHKQKHKRGDPPMHWAVRKQRADYWHSIVRAAMIEQRVPRKLPYKPVKITFCWDDRLDIDNHAIAGKMTVDAMKGYLLQEDSRRYVRAVEHRYWDEKCIGVEIEEAGQ